MSLSTGTRLGPYEIAAKLGEGGMGEVYRASDTRLNRVVAIKALHDLFAQHPERVGRFEREAQLLASLNHPNIAAIHGLEEVQGSKYLVLEFVDGRTLGDVLKEGALPLAEAMAIARQIADALSAAHERGIIHRDLKPGNVMVTSEGVVKVLDFGLGKALESEPQSETSNSPTMTMAATQAGIILGTAGYMSPEQAKGRVADKRSDVWAFGCVLFEMLTGRQAFEGEDITEILAAIVRGEPDWKLFPSNAPAAIRELVERCLIKNKAERLSDMSVVRYLLSDRTHAGSTMSGTASVVMPAARGRAVGWPIVAGLMAASVIATAGIILAWPSAPVAPVGALTRLDITLPAGDQLNSVNQMPVAISPDGSTVVYAAQRGGVPGLYVRTLSETEPKALVGTEGAKSPFFSPDNRWIGFFAQGKLKKIAIGGAAMQTIADAPEARGGTWDSNDIIYFAPRNSSGLLQVSAAGGAPATEFTSLDRTKGETSHRWPYVIPGQQTILFAALTGPGRDEGQIVAQSLGTGARHSLIQGGATPKYLSTGHLLYGNLDRLFAVPWTPSQTSLAGVAPVPMPEFPRLENESGLAYGASNDGTLVYVASGTARTRNRVVWMDHAGKTEVLSLPEQEYESVIISPQGNQAMVQVYAGTVTLWTLDLARQTLSPFVTSGSSQAPVWTTNGQRVIYRGTRNGFRNLYWKSADGTGPEMRLTEKEGVVQTATSVSPDGKWVVFNEGSPTGSTIWRVPLDSTSTPPSPELLFAADERSMNGNVSRDGKWLAFQSELSGRWEVYVQPFPGPGARKKVSSAGGSWPLWSKDGRNLYFDSLDGRIMVADVSTAAGLSIGVPQTLFENRFKTSSNSNTPFDVSLDGRRFLGVQPVRPDAGVTQIQIVLNWATQLGRR